MKVIVRNENISCSLMSINQWCWSLYLDAPGNPYQKTKELPISKNINKCGVSIQSFTLDCLLGSVTAFNE